MNSLIKIAILTVSVAASAVPAAYAEQIELVTGIGFGNNRAEAMQNAVRAWINQSVRDYGSADWNSAYKGQMHCSQLEGGASGGFTTLGIGVEGNPTGNWSCSVSGLPSAALPG